MFQLLSFDVRSDFKTKITSPGGPELFSPYFSVWHEVYSTQWSYYIKLFIRDSVISIMKQNKPKTTAENIPTFLPLNMWHSRYRSLSSLPDGFNDEVSSRRSVVGSNTITRTNHQVLLLGRNIPSSCLAD